MQKFLLVILFICTNVFLNSYAAGLAAANLDAILNANKTMQAQFKQLIYDNKNKLIQQSSGRIYLKRPGKLRWEISHPIPQIVIANGRKLWIYDPDLEQVTIRNLNKMVGETPALLLSQGSSNIAKDFVVKNLGTKAGVQWFSFVSHHRDSVFEYIHMGFLHSILKEMRLQDNLGHLIVINYSNIIANRPISDSLFVFHPPANVDVINES